MFTSHCNSFSGKCLLTPFAHFSVWLVFFLNYINTTEETSFFLSEALHIFPSSVSFKFWLWLWVFVGVVQKSLKFHVVKFISLSFKVHASSTSRNSSITWAHKNNLLYFLLCILKFCLWYLTLDLPQIYLFIHLFWHGLMQDFFFLTKKKNTCSNTTC